MHTSGDRLLNQQFMQLSELHDYGLDLGSDHTAYHRISLVVLLSI